MARKRYNFWLDDKRAEDWQVNDLITKLKGRSQFTRAIREGLRLWTACRKGDPSVLCELFPDMAKKLGATIIEKPVPTPDGAGGLDEIKGLLEMIASQQKSGSGYLMQSGQPDMIAITSKPAGLKAPPKFDLPSFEDDDELPTIALNKNTSNNAAANLLAGLAGLG